MNNDILRYFRGVQAANGEFVAFCPCCESDKTEGEGHLSIAEGVDGLLLYCFHGCAFESIVKAAGLPRRNGFATGRRPVQTAAKQERSTQPGRKERKKFVCAYPYIDAAGKLLYEVCRFNVLDADTGDVTDKTFLQRRPDPKADGGWNWKVGDTPRVLYRLRELIEADHAAWVFICEGEKDCDNLRAIGLIATCNAGGAGKWKHVDDSPLAGRRVCVVADKDVPGRKHAQDVAARLCGKAAEVKVLEMPGDEDIKDVSDWAAEFRDAADEDTLRAELFAMAESAPIWMPTAGGSASTDSRPSSTPVVIHLSGVKAEPVRWIWPGRVALGKLCLLAGPPGVGKSFLTLDIAARLTNGEHMPGCTEHTEAGGVVLLSAEDDVADTILPRLLAAGADVGRIDAITSVRKFEQDREVETGFSLEDDLPALETAIKAMPGCKLVVLDPVSAFLGQIDSHANAAVRGVLSPLQRLAAQYHVAVVAVTHLRKSGEGSGLNAVMGSLAFVAAARSAFLVVKDKDDVSGHRRLFLCLKSNISAEADGLAYRLEDSGLDALCVAWEPGSVTITADEALRAPRVERESPELDEAEAWLRVALAEGPQPAREVLKGAVADGFTKRTIERAKAALHIHPRKSALTGGWTWTLPDQHQADDEGH